MFKRKIYIIIFFIFITGTLFGFKVSDIVAYPVPFNPKTGNVRFLTIGNAPGTGTITSDKFKIEVFDINGDLVIKRSYNSSSVKWNGRNSYGAIVKPGLYLIKVTIENTPTGDYGQKMIRILVKY